MLSYLRLALWILFWTIIWPIMQLFRKDGQHNCVTWALKEWEDKEDGYIVIRWCRSSRFKWLRWPHLLYLDQEHNDKLRHFLPSSSKIDKKIVPAIWFDGTERIGDPSKDSADEN